MTKVRWIFAAVGKNDPFVGGSRRGHYVQGRAAVRGTYRTDLLRCAASSGAGDACMEGPDHCQDHGFCGIRTAVEADRAVITFAV